MRRASRPTGKTKRVKGFSLLLVEDLITLFFLHSFLRTNTVFMLGEFAARQVGSEGGVWGESWWIKSMFEWGETGNLNPDFSLAQPTILAPNPRSTFKPRSSQSFSPPISCSSRRAFIFGSLTNLYNFAKRREYLPRQESYLALVSKAQGEA